MRDDEVTNDGSNIHLGYMPSRYGIVRLLNTLDLDIEEDLYDEGRAIDGDDFRGILLFDVSDNSLTEAPGIVRGRRVFLYDRQRTRSGRPQPLTERHDLP
jgi:hypothetical protein